ncbi:MAG: hypothetical protein GDA50_06565 [Alphaproteobacteria bacterium GM202ARS2]|nr:hypothetical protein [Alphaproteobacteria bacterium GM202ARS2]
MRLMVCVLALVVSLPSAAYAEATRIKVSVLSKGAKFIGSSLGGARIILRDAENGEVLAEGITEGTTGDTAKIMMDDHEPYEALSSADSAHFTVTLDLKRPRLIEFEAYGPLSQRQAANRATMTQWVVPGKHIDEGDGMVLVIAGMAVDILNPAAHRRLELGDSTTKQVSIVANVTMMCGCPIFTDGLWPPEEFEVKAVVSYQGKVLATRTMGVKEIPSQFETTLSLSDKGWYDVVVYAYQPKTGNSGLDRSSFAITR